MVPQEQWRVVSGKQGVHITFSAGFIGQFLPATEFQVPGFLALDVVDKDGKEACYLKNVVDQNCGSGIQRKGSNGGHR